MKNKLIIFNLRIGSLAYWLIGIFVFIGTLLHAQSISPKVIATAGGFQSNASGSLSFTIGETNTQTLSSATNMLTQGFQQPFELSINLKAYLQGYYVGAGLMTDVLFNQAEYTNPTLLTDTITIELHDANTPFNVLFQTKNVIAQNGMVNIKGLGNLGQSYYIVIKHRNSIETWSASPILLTSNTTYDFTTNANQAFGSNQVQVAPNVYALYSGDINQDDAIDAFDYLIQDPDIINGESGYLVTDLNGDGSVDSFDYILLDANLTNGVGLVSP